MRFHIVFCLLILKSISGSPQDRETHLLTKFSQNEGLSSYNIRSVTQDPRGFIWIATQDGLNLFDGKTFVQYNYNMPDDKKLMASDVRALAVDTPRSLIWVLTNTGGLNAIDYITGRVTRSIPAIATTNDDWNITMVLCNNKLWLGCMTGVKVYNIKTGSWEKSPAMNFVKDKSDDLFSVRTIQKDRQGNIWAFVNHYGIVVLDSLRDTVIGKMDRKHIDDQQEDLLFTSAADIHDRGMLVGTPNGLAVFSLHDRAILRLNLYPVFAPMARTKISAMYRSAKYVYIADENYLYKVGLDLKSYTILKEFNASYADNWFKEIYNLYADGSENLWVGCKQGVAFLPPQVSPFISFNIRNYPNSGLNHVFAVLRQGNGKILVGQENGLLQFDSLSNKFTQIERTKAYNFLAENINGSTIVSADDGLYTLTDGRLFPIVKTFPELKPLSDCYINSIERLNAYTYVIGTDNDRGIAIWNSRDKTVRVMNNNTSPVRLRSNIVNRVFIDSIGNIWVLSDRGIDIIGKDLSGIKYLDIRSKSAVPFKLYFDIVESENSFWLACYGYGIIRIGRDGRLLQVLNTNNGLCNDGVYKIFKGTRGSLIITSNNGISVLDRRTGRFNNYFEHDGLHANAFEEACGTVANGRIYCGGLNGFSIIDPRYLFVNNIAPRLCFNKVAIETKDATIWQRNLDMTTLIIPADALQTTISFAGINFINPARVTFNYNIAELNKKWIDLGNQNFINIIGLNPGSYTLRVRSSNEAGIWNKNPVELNLVILPKWYQTTAFKLGVLLLILGTVHLVYRYRIRQIKIQQGIRREIASDLHDDLGGTLNTIKIFTHLALEQQNGKEYLERISEHTVAAAVGLRDMLWVLEEADDTVGEVVNRIVKYALPVLEARNISLSYKIEEQAGKYLLTKKEKRNVLMICKEAITNSLKYANCQSLSILVSHSADTISLSVQDNGNGFDMNSNTGHGLNNMRYRASQINFDIEIRSDKSGTVIKITKKKTSSVFN